jgi:hypothetical protein
MKELGNTIYAFGCVVAATVLGIGIADYWFGNHQLTAFLSWAVLATIPWLVGFAFTRLAQRLAQSHKLSDRLRTSGRKWPAGFSRR